MAKQEKEESKQLDLHPDSLAVHLQDFIQEEKEHWIDDKGKKYFSIEDVVENKADINKLKKFDSAQKEIDFFGRELKVVPNRKTGKKEKETLGADEFRTFAKVFQKAYENTAPSTRKYVMESDCNLKVNQANRKTRETNN